MSGSVPHPSTSSLREEDGDRKEEQVPLGTPRRQPLMPEDGYEWKKYGQKHIKNISKIRSYFKCRNRECKAKKRVEWFPTYPYNPQTFYDGTHNHQPPSDIEHLPNLTANQYELGNQVFGQLNDHQQQ